MKGSTFATALILVIVGGLSIYAYSAGLFGDWSVPGQVTPPGDTTGGDAVIPVTQCDSSTSPTVTIKTPDVYGGAAVTTQNSIRLCGESAWTDVAGAATFTANPGDKYEIIFGIDSDDDDAEPFGPHITCTSPYVVPCSETPSIEKAVVDDALSTDLVALAYDPDDGNIISNADELDVDAGQMKNVRFKWQGAYEEDFGNRFLCEDTSSTYDCYENILVVRYNTTEYDSMKVTRENGQVLTPASVPVVLSATSGYSDRAYKFPILKSNKEYWHTLVIDSDDTYNPTGNQSNITLYLYDASWFMDNDVTPSQIKSGVEDEDYAELAATSADSLTININEDI